MDIPWCKAMQSHDERRDGNKCHATSTLYARKINKAAVLSLSSVHAYQNKPVSIYILFYLLMDFILFINVAFHAQSNRTNCLLASSFDIPKYFYALRNLTWALLRVHKTESPDPLIASSTF